ncbi:MAG TPA: hypothetical protein VE569_05665, partial [Acidimicrobiia bacterium]|nr:hypothetical protein [Acidimicrobiia bacterium]
AAVAVGWGVLIVLVAVNLASVLPLPDGWEQEIDESTVVELIAGDEALSRRVFETLAGDNVMAQMASIQDTFGSSRAVASGDEVLEFPAARADEIRQVRDEADDVLTEVNTHRVDAGLNAVTVVAPITDLAEDHAEELYRSGQLRGLGDCAARLESRGYRVLRCDDQSALAGTATAAFDAIRETEEGRAMLENPNLDRGGISVVDGPTGRLVVIVMAG